MTSSVLFSWGDFARIGILINVGIWLRMRWLRCKYEKENVFVNVYIDQKLRDRVTYSQLLFYIWVPLFVIVCVAVFPTVYVVSADKNVKTQSAIEEQTYTAKKYYVPFHYNGGYYKPFKRYISNETDSILALYEYEIWFGDMRKAGLDKIKALILPQGTVELTKDMRITDAFVLPDTSEYMRDIKKIGMLDFLRRAVCTIKAIQSYNMTKYGGVVEEPDSSMVFANDSI